MLLRIKIRSILVTIDHMTQKTKTKADRATEPHCLCCKFINIASPIDSTLDLTPRVLRRKPIATGFEPNYVMCNNNLALSATTRAYWAQHLCT